MNTNVTRRVDPLEDFFRGFFVRPVDFGGGSGSVRSGSLDSLYVPEGCSVNAVRVRRSPRTASSSPSPNGGSHVL